VATVADGVAASGTAVISDLHLGSRGARAALTSDENRRSLFAELANAERVVLLGDTIELLEAPPANAFEVSRPFFEELGGAIGRREVILIPGNHDHHLARKILESNSVGGRLALEQRAAPLDGATRKIAAWLGTCELTVAYPGVWLRSDVYATHGHYMDCHRRALRTECVAAALSMRLRGRLPPRPSPEDYERILSPLYRFGFELAQISRGRGLAERNHRRRGGVHEDPRQSVTATRLLNRALDSEFDPGRSWDSISELGIAGSKELVRHLEIDARHVLMGHSHRAGPNPGEATWEAWPGGPSLYNTGSWYRGPAFEAGGPAADLFRPGSIAWVRDSGAPEIARLDLAPS
jgi:hypothetical protein